MLTGIIFVLKSGILWEMLPKEMGSRLREPLPAATARLARRSRGVAQAALGAPEPPE